MANKYRYRWGPKVDRRIAKTGTVAVEIGDMIKFTSSGKVQAVSASTDSTALVGVAMSASPTTDATNTEITVRLIGNGSVFEYPMAAAAKSTYGSCYVATGAQQLTSKTVVNLGSTATNVVCICAQDMDATGTNVFVEFLPGRFAATISAS